MDEIENGDIPPEDNVKKILDCNAIVGQKMDCIGARVLLNKIDDLTAHKLNQRIAEYLDLVSEKLDGFLSEFGN